jgi:hypothetical protein
MRTAAVGKDTAATGGVAGSFTASASAPPNNPDATTIAQTSDRVPMG